VYNFIKMRVGTGKVYLGHRRPLEDIPKLIGQFLYNPIWLNTNENYLLFISNIKQRK